MTATKSIHTLNARDHVMLEVMRDHLNLSPQHMLNLIQGLRAEAEGCLNAKGIAYDSLKSALVPDRKRKEIALVFESSVTGCNFYGADIFKRLIPLFDKRSNHSILTGDYSDRRGNDDIAHRAFSDAVQLARDVRFRHPTQFHIVYINNLTDNMIIGFDENLRDYRPYVGFADTTFSSSFKILLSTMLPNLGIKHGTIFLQGHEPDRDPEDDVNMCGYPFEKNGYVCRSISDDLMGVLLSYKIERPVAPGFEADTEFSLNAVNPSPLPLSEFQIAVSEAKLAYVKDAKTGSAERAGIQAITADALAELIAAKISASYIYNLSGDAIHNVTKFNIIIELPAAKDRKATRLLASLEYQPDNKTLRLITLY